MLDVPFSLSVGDFFPLTHSQNTVILHVIFLPQRQILKKGAKEYKANKLLCFLRDLFILINLFCIAVSLKWKAFHYPKE